MEQMSVTDALTLLDKATSTLKLERTEHGMIITALQTLQRMSQEHQELIAANAAKENTKESSKQILGESVEKKD